MKSLHTRDFQALRRQAQPQHGGPFRGRLRDRYEDPLTHRATAEHIARLADTASEHRFHDVDRAGAEVERLVVDDSVTFASVWPIRYIARRGGTLQAARIDANVRRSVCGVMWQPPGEGFLGIEVGETDLKPRARPLTA